jgi:hypothetical protein
MGVFLGLLALAIVLFIAWLIALPAVAAAYAIIATATPASQLMTTAAWIAATVLIGTGVVLLVAWRRSVRRAFTHEDAGFSSAVLRYWAIVYLLAIGGSAAWGLTDVDPYLGSPQTARAGVAYLAGFLALLPIASFFLRSKS